MSNPNNRKPKRPINQYDEVNEVVCDHDIPITHIRRRGRWIPYVSNLFYIIIFILNFNVGVFMAQSNRSHW